MPSKKIYRFRAELFDSEPLIWRQFEVSNDTTLISFCYILMTLFEMRASHLFSLEFPLGGRGVEQVWRYDYPVEHKCPSYIDEDEEEELGMAAIKLSDIMDKAGRGFIFVYDFGDNWAVPMEIEYEFVDGKYRSTKYPRVLDGEGYGILENCGGVYRLAKITAAYKKKRGKDYKEFREWLDIDDLDLAAFDKKDMNFRLKKIPHLYEAIYEGYELDEEDINLIEREYLYNGGNQNESE